MLSNSPMIERLVAQIDRIDSRTHDTNLRLERIEAAQEHISGSFGGVAERIARLERLADIEEGRRQGQRNLVTAATGLGTIGAGSGIFSLIQQLLGG